MEFAKSFTLENGHQVLYTMNETNDEDAEAPYSIIIRCDVKGLSFSATLGYETETDMKEAFEEATTEKAYDFYNAIIAIGK